MRLDFTGDLSWWQGLAIAALGGLLAWSVYRRDVRTSGKRWARALLPALRSGAIAAVLVALVAPVLTHRRTEGEVGRVLVFVDGSRSMGATDEHLDPARKLLLASAGKLPAAAAPLAEIVDALREARRAAADLPPASGARPGGRLLLPTAAGGKAADADGAKVGPAPSESVGRLQRAIARAAQRIPELDPSDLPRATGAILAEYYDGVVGNRVGDLETSGRLGAPPSSEESRTTFESRRGRGDGYGTRMRGFLRPPLTGSYVFWIAGDDESVLYLGAGEDPASKRPIARIPEYCSYGEWERSPEQKSDPIELQAGEEYWIEALHKEGSGDDFVAVGWRRPDGKEERPIPGIYLAPPAGAGAEALERLKEAFEREVAGPSRRLEAAAGKANGTGARGGGLDVSTLSRTLASWEARLEAALAARSRSILESGGTELRDAAAAFDATTRWKRAEAILLDGDSGLVPALSDTHEVEVLELVGGEARRLWGSASSEPAPISLPGEPGGEATDLGSGIAATLGEEQDRTAVVLLSDGRHNDGGSPGSVARVLGRRGVPIFTVGLGAHREPPDISVAGVEGPASVFAEDRFHGQVAVTDRMPPGLPFAVTVSHGDLELWRKDFQTTGGGERKLEVDFAVRDIAGEPGRRADVEILSLPAALRVAVEPVTGEARAENNEATLRFRVVTQGRRILLLDGRPRWETRFLRNLFGRDEQWRIDTLIAEVGGGAGEWTRGDGPGELPKDREALLAYGLIILGDLPAARLGGEQPGWIREFVEARGGGIIFIDGRRGHLRDLERTALGPLLPVERGEGGGETRPERLELTAAGRALAALRLEKGSEENVALWRRLPAPHWSAPCRALEGTETLAEVVGADGKRTPALVRRRFGAGEVLYASFDASWRWRYEVADRYHARYWNQVANRILEEPFAVRDEHVALDAGGPLYGEGDSARLRVRLTGRDGKPLLEARAEAILFRGGDKIASVALEPDPARGGTYRGATAALEAGEYEVGLLVEGFSELETKARTSFAVEPRKARELAELTCDETLLGQMASLSGGTYLREEDAGKLAALLEPLSEGRIVTSETRLANSYWWFVPIALLLALEWFLRKRAGMV